MLKHTHVLLVLCLAFITLVGCGPAEIGTQASRYETGEPLVRSVMLSGWYTPIGRQQLEPGVDMLTFVDFGVAGSEEWGDRHVAFVPTTFAVPMGSRMIVERHTVELRQSRYQESRVQTGLVHTVYYVYGTAIEEALIESNQILEAGGFI